MAIGERIRFFRTKQGLTQKALGMLLGFPEKSADVRLAQYETGTRTPKADLTAALAHILGVSPQALTVPDIDSLIGLAHTLFTLEDVYGLTVCSDTEGVCLRVTPGKHDSEKLLDILTAWWGQAEKLGAGVITREEYDRWRYYYPKFDDSQRWGKVPSQALSDGLIKAYNDMLDEEKTD